MQALVLKAVGCVEPCEVSKPEPGPGEALVRVLSAGICGSELHAFRGRHPKRTPPAIMGHEVCGVVEKIDTGIIGPAVGTRVVVLPQKSCGQCRWCRTGRVNLCDSKTMLGETSWPGGFAEYYTTPAELLYPVPETLSDDAAVLIEPLAVAVHAVRTSGIGLGDRIVVAGAGAIGLMVTAAALAAGAASVLVSDLFAYNLEKARALGATYTCKADQDDVVAMARKMSDGEGADAFFMAADGPELFQNAVASLRKQGVLSMIAMFTQLRTVNLQVPKARELTIRGSLTFDSTDFAIAVRLAGQLGKQLEPLVTHRFSLAQGAEAFRLADRHTEDCIKIVVKP